MDKEASSDWMQRCRLREQILLEKNNQLNEKYENYMNGTIEQAEPDARKKTNSKKSYDFKAKTPHESIHGIISNNNEKKIQRKNQNIQQLSRREKAEKGEEVAMKQLLDNFRNDYVDGNIKPNDIRKLYSIGSVLGEGAFGKVRLGKQTLTGLQVAIKSYLQSELDINPYDGKNFSFKEERKKLRDSTHETDILSRLNHPNVIRLFETITTSNDTHLIMEYCSGGNLKGYLQRHHHKGINNRKIKRWIYQMLSSLFYLHTQGVIHRDLKPSNILLDNQDNIKIADFGIATKFNDESDMISDCRGTFGYMAPEQLMGPCSGRMSDIWAIGMIAYTLITGKEPFINLSEKEFLVKVKQCNTLQYPPNVCNEAKELIQGLLNYYPKKRWSIDQALHHSWFDSKLVATLNDSMHSIFIESIIHQVSHLTGKSYDSLKVSLINNERNHLTSTYWLLYYKSTSTIVK